MAVETRALGEVLGLRSPRWAIERSLIDAAIRLTESGSQYNPPQTILRRARERAAWRSAPTIPPTAGEIRNVLKHGDEEARTQVLVRLVLAELEQQCHTKGAEGKGTTSERRSGNDPPPPAEVPDGP